MISVSLVIFGLIKLDGNPLIRMDVWSFLERKIIFKGNWLKIRKKVTSIIGRIKTRIINYKTSQEKFRDCSK